MKVGNNMNKNILKYEIKNDEVTITGCDKFATIIEIPSEIEGYPVTSISEYAFKYCSAELITIPPSITTIDENAFKGCASLKTIFAPSVKVRINGELLNGRVFEDSTSISVNLITYLNGLGVDYKSTIAFIRKNNNKTLQEQCDEFAKIYFYKFTQEELREIDGDYYLEVVEYGDKKQKELVNSSHWASHYAK